MKRILIGIAILIVIVLAIMFRPEKEGPTGGPPKAGLKPAMATFIIVKDTLFSRAIQASGSLLAQDIVHIAPEISGRIKSISFREGAAVSKGQLLVKLEDKDLQAQLKKLIALKDLAETNAKREKALLQGGGTSAELLERAENTVTTLFADIEVVKAAIAKTEIRAPFSGMIGIKEISEGSYVSAGTHITELVNAKPIRIECTIPERYAQSVAKGMSIDFTVSGITEHFTAKIIAIDPMINEQSRTIRLIAEHNNGKNTLKPGGFAEITIPLSGQEKAIMIPAEAAVPDIRGLRVFVLEQGKAKPRPIETGIRTESSLEIKKGLGIGETLLVAGASLLKPNSQVNAKPAY